MTGVCATLAILAADPAAAAHLVAWEKAVAGPTVSAEFTLTRTDPVRRKTTEFAGSYLAMRPDKGRLRLDPKGVQNAFTAYVRTGGSVYEYDGLAKQVTRFRMAVPTGVEVVDPARKPGVALLLAWLIQPGANGIGLAKPLPLDLIDGTPSAAQLLARFAVRVTKEDPNYVYLTLTPRAARDRAEFASVVVVLYGPKAAGVPAYRPRTILGRRPDGTDEQWDVDRTTDPGPLSPRLFDYVPPPPDWKAWLGPPAVIAPARD